MNGVLGDFHKYEGLGNDFVVLDVARGADVSVAEARRLCDRRRGVGGDGVLLVAPPSDAGAAGRMVVINADGSIPEMCGNGLRCVALHLARARGQKRAELLIETGAGPKLCVVDVGDAGAEAIVAIDMSPVRFVEDVRLELDGDGAWDFALADAGNPHAITLRPASRAEIERVGPRVATHSRFAHGTNVEFAVVRSPREIDLVVWERGVGITEACGTGACATVVAGVANGWAAAGEDVAVHLPGGTLRVHVEHAPRDRVTMTGPARHVFAGHLDTPRGDRR